MVQRLREGWLEEELAKVEQVRDPPVPVMAWLAVDGENHEGLLYGWATNPNGADDGWRGLVRGVREYARWFEAEFLSWVRAEHVSRIAS
jgi:hypothetical protein